MELRIVGTTDDPAPPSIPTLVSQSEPEVTFGDWYLLYPRHVARKDAEKAWSRIDKSMYIKIMVATFAWRRVWLDRGEMEYVPHPATFLNGERWDDDLPPGYTLMPRTKTPVAVQPEGERVPMPEHVRLLLAKLKGGGK